MKTVQGKVVSVKMKGTAVVQVERYINHPLYHKRIRKTKKLHADNLINAALGAMVVLTEVKPISKTKNWSITKVY